MAPPVLLAKGCANVIRLEKFKTQAGDRWTRIREGVYARLESLIRGMLGPSDFFARIEDTAYLVVMPMSDPEDVNVTCLRVAFELHTSFLGQCNIDHIEVGTAQASPDGEGLALEPLPVERIIKLAAKAGIQLAAPQQQPAKPVEQISAYRHPANHPAGLVLPITPAHTEFSIEHEFLPIWSVPNLAVTTYLCEAKAIHAAHRRDAIPFQVLSPTERVDVEMSCFRKGIELLAKAIKAKRPFLLALAMPFDVLGSPQGRKEILSALHNLDHDFRQYISFIITEAPLGVAQTRLATMVTLLKPFSRAVSATVAPRTKNFDAYGGIGLTSIGYSQKEFSRGQAPSQHEIEALALFARRHNLAMFMDYVHNVNMLKHAQDAGVQFLSGTAVAQPCVEPRGMWRLTWDKLMSESLVELWV